MVKLSLKSQKETFKLSFDGIFSYKSDKKIKVHIDGTEFIFKSIDFKEPINEVFENVSGQHTFDIDTVFKGSLDEVSLFRMFFFDNSKRT